MKKLGRRHRPFFRICAMDQRRPRDGRVLEELGTYDPMIADVDARAVLDGERVAYWLGVGAQPSDNVAVLIKKYGLHGTHLGQQKQAIEKLAQPKAIPDPGAAIYQPKSAEEAVAVEDSDKEEAPAQQEAEATAEAVENKETVEQASSEEPKTEASQD